MKSMNRALLLSVVAMWATAACSSEPESEHVGQSSQAAVLLNCANTQLNTACDPDGATTTLGQCDGLCTFDPTSPSGKLVCRPIVDLGKSDLAGYLCGSG